MTEIKNRYDFVLFFDVQDGNPNGDPDAGNLPRVDPDTGMGLVTDVCLKRKIRNYIQLTKGTEPGYDIFVKERAVLNYLIEAGWDAANPGKDVAALKGADKNTAEDRARAEMCRRYFDIRAFGAVLSTGTKTAGQVKGPVQIAFARSVEPITTLEHTITRMAVTNAANAGNQRTMGRKFTVPYGLYRCCGFISPFFAKQTGFGEEDLQLFWAALHDMFEHDRSAARGLMSARRLVIFKHQSELGSAPAADLFARVKCERTTDPTTPARSFEDYKITVDGNVTERFSNRYTVE